MRECNTQCCLCIYVLKTNVGRAIEHKDNTMKETKKKKKKI